MYKTITTILLCTTSLWSINEGFNFTECSGSGSFEQQIQHYGKNYEHAITVGSIPQGIQGLRIELISDKDVDIRLYGQNNDKVVHWPHGKLSESTQASTNYMGAKVTYSGYDGINGKRGNEFITVEGNTPTAMTMKAFGYKAGFARINYSWTGRDNCTQSGDGNFTQSITKNALSLVGEIPAGIPNLKINLTSSNDLDIQLYGADGTVVVGWKPTGILNGAGRSTIHYKNMNIEWSGYDGIGGNAGNEYIIISGATTEILTLKVYGYEAGFANVSYSWGEDNNSCKDSNEPVCGKITDIQCITEPCETEQTFDSKCLLEEANATFLYDGECGSKICTSWNDGCNECYLDENNNQICTEMMCVTQGEYTCHKWEEPKTSCKDNNEPVCGKITDIQCITEPCETEQTFDSKCFLEEANATFLYDGECGSKICLSWYDGCSECHLDMYNKPICSDIMCITQGEYLCHTWGIPFN